jgi:hypothetical protein
VQEFFFLVNTTYRENTMSLTKVSYSMIDGAAVNFLDYGASTTATAAQNKAALVAALAASNAVYIPQGTYNIDGNINIKNKTIFGEPTTFGATTGSKLVLSGLNSNAVLFTNGGNTGEVWGTGGGCTLRDLYLVGNWDGIGANPNTETNFSLIGALLKFYAGAYVIVQDCTFYNCFGFGLAFYKLGYSSFQTLHVTQCAKNGITVTGNDLLDGYPTSTSIVNCSIGTIRGTGSTGGNAIALGYPFGITVNGCVLEDVLNGVYIDGTQSRNVSIIGNHIENYSVAGVNYAGSGTGLGLFGNYFSSSSPPAIVQSNPLFTTYTAWGNNAIPPTIEGTLSSNIIQQYASVAFSAGNFTSNSGTWVVASGDATTYQYQIINKTMTINFYVETSTVTGTPTQLRIAIPEGKLGLSKTVATFGYWDNETGTGGTGLATVLVNQAYVSLTKDITNTAWQSSADRTYVWGQITFDIQ